MAGRRVAYFAMKPQLRGRFRRNVQTLLQMGAIVTVLTVRSDLDFFLGLNDPNLAVAFFDAESLYVRLSKSFSRRSKLQADRRRAKVAQRAARMQQGEFVATPTLLLAGLLIALRRGWKRLSPPIRRAGWAMARTAVRTRRRVLRLLPRDPRKVLRRAAKRQQARRRRALTRRAVRARFRVWGRAMLNRRLRLSRSVVAQLKDWLRPWHRVNRFFAFWKESAARGRQLRPDLVFSSDLPGLVGAGRTARALHIPHVHDCHELYLESTSFRRTERMLLEPMERKYLRRADSATAVNESIAAEYGKRYGRKPVVVRNCADSAPGDIAVRDLRELARISPDSRVLLYQGGFSVGRGLDVCVAASALLPEDVHLVLLGFGPLTDQLADIAESLGITDRVHIIDAVPPAELASLTRSADAGLIPYQPVSLNNYLALPNKIFEYTAAGVPVIVSDMPELRRIAVDAGCGAAYDPFDAESLAAAVREVLDPARYPAYRRAATDFGRLNVWENEQLILRAEIVKSASRPSRRLDNARSDRHTLVGS